MLPFYLLGNLHCAGMCGPLVMLIGKHRYRWFYFLGRTVSFSLAGLLAGSGGAVINLALHQYNLTAMASFAFAVPILWIGISNITGFRLFAWSGISNRISQFSQPISLLILQDRPWPTFLFGFFTVALPCGQTLIVFSACALSGDPLVGLFNGCCFALLTSPSLLAAMSASTLFHKAKHYYHLLFGLAAILVGMLALCRGMADLGIIPHLVLSQKYHLVIY